MRSALIYMLLLLAAITVQAEIYRWTDKQGNVHFGDRPPSTAKSKRVEVRTNTYESVEVYYNPDWFYHRPKAKGGRKQVVMYSAQWCGVCKKAKAYFSKNKIPFKELDIDKSKEAREGYKKLNGSGVPIILVGKQRMNGFSPQRFEKMYQSAN